MDVLLIVVDDSGSEYFIFDFIVFYEEFESDFEVEFKIICVV